MKAEQAALVNGSFAHSLDYDDTHRGSSLHPGAPVISAALAAGERTDASGTELLTAIVGGYDVVCRIGMAVNPSSHYDCGFHMTATCGLFGATAAVGMVLGLTADELEAAFGVNGSQAAGSLQFLENGGWNKRFHPGLAAHSALVSIALARNDFFAASEPIEGDRGFLYGYSDAPHPEKATAGLGDEYELLNTGIKPYPCCRYMHNAMDLLLELAESEDVDADSVNAVTVRIPETGIGIVGHPTNRYPQSFVDAQFNMAFGAALCLCRREATIDAFLDGIEGGVDEELKRIIDATTVTTVDWIEDAFPEKWVAAVEIETSDATYTERSEYPRGAPEDPLSWEEIVAKYEELTEPVVGAEAASAVRRRVEDLESTSVSELLQPLANAEATAANADD